MNLRSLVAQETETLPEAPGISARKDAKMQRSTGRWGERMAMQLSDYEALVVHTQNDVLGSIITKSEKTYQSLECTSGQISTSCEQ